MMLYGQVAADADAAAAAAAAAGAASQTNIMRPTSSQ